jgi:hypothetical protein
MLQRYTCPWGMPQDLYVNIFRLAAIVILASTLFVPIAHARTPTPRDQRFCARVEKYGLAQYQMALSGNLYHKPYYALHETVRRLDPDDTLLWAAAQRLINGEGLYGTPVNETVSQLCLDMVRMNSLQPLHDDQHYVAPPPPTPPEAHVGKIERVH